MLAQFDAGSNVGMGYLRALGAVMVAAAILVGAYFLYIRPAFGKTGVASLALVVFFLYGRFYKRDSERSQPVSSAPSRKAERDSGREWR